MENPYQPPQIPQTPESSPPPLPAAVKAPWNGWWTLLWVVLLIVAWQILAGIGIIIAAAQRGIFQDLSDSDRVEEALLELALDGDIAGLLTFVTIFLVCPLCWLLGQVRPGFTGWEYLGKERPKWWHWFVWSAAVLGINALFTLIAPHLGVHGTDESMVKMGTSTQYPILLYLGVAVGAPFVEEFIFRGTIWRGWRASKLGLRGALVATSLCWAVLHVQYPVAIIAYIFFFGLVLGLAREKTGNIWVPVWMHALNNGLATYEMLKL